MSRDLDAMGERLKTARESRKFTQAELAKILNKSKQLVSAWESGKSEITVSTVKQFARALNVDVRTLLFGGDSPAIRSNPSVAGDPWTVVPVLDDELVSRLAREQLCPSKVATEAKLIWPWPASQETFAYEVCDNAMMPSIGKGDIIVVDTERAIEPGLIVIAVINRNNGQELADPMLVLREIRPLNPVIASPPYELVAGDQRWPTIKIASTDDGRIMGALVGRMHRT